MNSLEFPKWLVYTSLLLVFILPIPSWTALILGLLISLLKIRAFEGPSTHVTTILQLAVVLLGFGLHFTYAYGVVSPNLLLISITTIAVFLGGYAISRLFGLKVRIGLLIAAGTAICGGSAIAAVSSAIKAEKHEISIALTCVFTLNGLAAVLFPAVGHAFELNQEVFGQWAAMAIHDTSSVLAATEQFGEESLKIGATLKLTRSLWIIPIVLMLSLGKHGKVGKVSIPYFILGFILAMTFRTVFQEWEHVSMGLYDIGKRGMTVALFLIGTTLSVRKLVVVGSKPLLFSAVLWILVSACLLWVLIAI